MVSNSRIRLSQVLESQIPDFVNDEFPLFKDFLRQYFESNEIPGGSYDLLSNIDRYVKIDEILLSPDSTTIDQDFDFDDETLIVRDTTGFPYSYGLLKINNEIITYKSKTKTTFEGCVRGFSGISEIGNELVFEETLVNIHLSGSTVENISKLFLNEFFKKVKRQIAPGFEERELNENVNPRLFYKQVNDFYASKGTEESFKILFSALYNDKIDIIRPSDNVFEASASSNRKTTDLVLYSLEDIDYTDLILNRTLYQREVNSQDPEDPITAYGTITNVERIQRGTERYYIVSLDSDYDKDLTVSGTVYGEFFTTATTRVVENYKQGVDGQYPEFLYVDSTIGFDNSTTLDVYLDDTVETLDINTRSVNEFYGVFADFEIPKGTLISSKRYAFVTLDDGTDAYFRVTNILSSLIPDRSSYFAEGDPVKFNTLGLKDESKKYNNWIFNNTPTFNISNITLVNINERKYSITLEGEFDLTINDRFFVTSSNNQTYDVQVVSRDNTTDYIIVSQSLIQNIDTETVEFFLERKLNKGIFKFFPEANNYLTDVQNVYRPNDLKDDMFIMSSSLPNYSNSELYVNDKRIEFTVNLPKDQNNKEIKVGFDATPTQPEKTHSFYTGDSIIYEEPEEDEFGEPNLNRLNISNGRYYVTVVDNKTIKLSTSLNRVYTKEYVTVEGNVSNNVFYYSDFTDIENVLNLEEPFILKSKKLVKNIKPPVETSNSIVTSPGKIGILKNGVEVLNYKSKNNIYYGKLEKIFVLAEGDDYDIINPPTLSIFDGQNADGESNGGIGATGNFVISGYIDEIKILDGGFNYIDPPTCKVFGGNGKDCDITPVMEKYVHSITIDASSGFDVGISSNTIITSESHYFYPGEKVLYNSNNQQEIIGLKNKSVYYVGVTGDNYFTLHNTKSDAENLVNEINLTNFGVGFHRFDATQKKQRISSLIVNYSSDDFTFRKVSYDPSLVSEPVDYYTNTIKIPNHGFSSGEIIVYEASTTPITGLTSSAEYYVTKVDQDSFKLSQVGFGTLGKDYYYNSKLYENISTSGVGRQYFKYPNIQVDVTPSLQSGFSIEPVTLPVTKGKIKSVFLENGGIGYGCTNILNYNKQPIITAEPGKLASIKPFIVDGVIQNVIVQNSGQGYVSNPSIQIFTDGSGFGAELIPVIQNGRLAYVQVKNGGADYNDSTELEVISAGSGAKFQAQITKWNVNEVERNLNSNQIYDDDGFIHQDSTIPIDEVDQYNLLQYTHCYAPRKLRQSLYNERVINGRTTFSPDLILDNLGRETDSNYHSPIIGWAYDGNPIYGPYGFSNSNGTGGVRRMLSGYKKRTLPGRPSLTTYPLGFFVNDYEWFSDGDLDIHNGRFCITPEYPNGVYAYFSTIGNNDATFKNFKLPVFPYFIGNSFKSSPIDFNFNSTVSQYYFTVSNPEDARENYLNYDLLRNITPYNLNSPFGKYDYIFNPTETIDIVSNIKKVSKGSVTNLNIFSGGINYKVGDKIIFSEDFSNSFQKRPLAKVSGVGETNISSVSVATSTITNVEFIKNPKAGNSFNVIGFCSTPHNLYSGIIEINNPLTNKKLSAEIKIISKELSIKSSIGQTSQTGIVTYFDVNNLDVLNNIIPLNSDDVFTIRSGLFSEEVKILNIDYFNSRIRVEREINGTIGTSYSPGTKLSEKPRKFLFNDDEINPLVAESSKVNTTYYFNPKESVGVGIGTTLNITNPGAGSAQIFVDGNKIYLPFNKLSTNDLVYYEYDNNPIQLDPTGNLENDTPYYAYSFPNGYIGLSSRPVGYGSTGIVGLGSDTQLLTFKDFGVGSNHKLRTDYNDVIKTAATTYEVTVTTQEDHNLLFDDSITFSCVPNTEKSYGVFYNEQNRKFAIGSFNFVHGNINASKNTITISDHRLTTGQKVILESTSPPGGLVNNQVYYVFVIDPDTIKLSIDNKSVVNITNQSTGRLIVINPNLNLVKNKTLTLDVSDFSLSYVRNNIRYSAFDFKFFYDKELRHEFTSSKLSSSLSVVKTGRIGVDANATVKLVCDDGFPEKLYYKLIPLKETNVPFSYSLASIDTEIENTITFVDSAFSGSFNIKNVTDKTFKYRVFSKPDSDSYTSSTADLSYSTISTTASGPITDIEFISYGSNLIKLPRIERIETQFGSDHILFPRSTDIGKAKEINISNIGFDFPTDTTLRPRAYSPTVFKIDPLTSIDFVNVLEVGINYTVLPDLVLLDGFTNKIVDDAVLEYVEEDTFKVNIIKNTKNLYDVNPRLLPINNSNGYKILSLTYDSGSKDATVILDVVGFSTITAWPFSVGTKFMIEGVITKDPDNDEGYNSSQYDYKELFTVKTDDPNIGGQLPSFTFNMADFVIENNPGIYEDLFTSGRVIPESYFPKFFVNRVPNKFFPDEIITNGVASDIAVSWDIKNELLKVFTSTPELYKIGDLITGKTSKSSGTLTEVVGITSLTYNLGPTNSDRFKFYDKKGFLNEESQRLHDSDYYQYFSYSIKSTTGISSWRDAVESLNHPSGMKKFSDLQIISPSPAESQMTGIQTGTGFLGISNFSSYYDLNCVHDIDLASENNIENYLSDELRFNSLILVDYFESIGNRVLIVDDISDEFNSNPRPTAFVTVDRFSLQKYRSKKYVVFTSNKKFPGERQVIIVNVIHNNIYGFLTQYGRVDTNGVQGYFDVGIFENNGLLLFYPLEFRFSDFNVSGYSYSAAESIVGVTTQFVGDISFVGIQTVTVPQGTALPYKIVGIDSSYTSAKVLVTIEKTDLQYYQYDEFNIVHDGTNIYETEFSTLATDNFADQDVSLGIGTYQFDYNGNEIEMKLVPNSGLSTDYKVFSTVVAISDTSRTSIGSSTYNTTLTTVGFASTSVGSATTSILITEIDSKYKGFNLYASIEDITYDIVQFSELIVSHNDTDAYLTEFGRVANDPIIEDTGIGTFTAYVDPTTKNTKIYFESIPVVSPNPNREVEIRVHVNSLSNVDTGINTNRLGYVRGEFSTFYGDYQGTENDVKRSFELRHQGDLIFEREFDASSLGTTVSVVENVLFIPNHFFVTGELVRYTYDEDDTPIGIETTSVAGIGTTDKLPTDLYVIKINSSKIQFTDTAEKALKFNPEPFKINAIGIGTQHKLTSTNKDAKGLFTIDNMIQSPIVELAITTTLLDDIQLTDTVINTVGITSFFGNDVIQINDEIMLIETVGIGTLDKIRVRRPWLGTQLGVHTAGDTVTKLSGDYKIVGSTINFTSPPYGKVPVTPDLNQYGVPFVDPSDRDYTGITTNSYFHGRTFMRSGIEDGSEETYTKNYIFDDISTKFTGIRTSFDLTVDGSDVLGISTDNAIILVKDIFQQPKRTGIGSIIGNYELDEVSSKTKILFEPTTLTPGEDVNSSNIPVGGVIVSAASTTGLGYQPLVAAGGTATISGFGSITSISIGNSGSGYRPGIQTHINVIAETSSSVSIIGFATALDGHITGVAITNPGTAYTSTNPPRIRFDSPLSYTNIPLIYSNDSVQGIGTKASLDIFVSRDTTVGEFKFNNNGYAYGQGEILTVAIGGSTGIPTDTSKVFDEFQITIDETHTDEFSAWSIGQLQQLDSLDERFDGVRRVFPISFQGDRVSIRSRPGSDIDVSSTLLVFINDILQIPNQSYRFRGGSLLIFSEPIPKEYTSRILFYRGTRDVDVEEVDIVEPIEEGDKVRLMSDIPSETENPRIVENILASDILLTNPYTGIGRIDDETYQRPVMACKQTDDLFINGSAVAKNRNLYEPYINPHTNLIQNVGLDTTVSWVENIKTFFDNKNENLAFRKLGQIEIISQEQGEVGFGTVVVSSGGTISSITITNSGIGYTFNPQISIGAPSVGGITAIATCIVTDGRITSINVTDGGSGYISTQKPYVNIEAPRPVIEKIEKVEYTGDFGSIVSIANTSVGIGSTALKLTLYVPHDSYLLNQGVNNSGFVTTGISGILTSYYFTTSDTNVGNGVTAFYNDGSVLSISTSYFNNIFQAYDINRTTEEISGIGVTDVLVVTTLVSGPIDLANNLGSFDNSVETFDDNILTFDNDGNDSDYFGNYSWGRITWDPVKSRKQPKSFDAYYQNGYSGLTTSPFVRRVFPLRSKLYTQYSN